MTRLAASRLREDKLVRRVLLLAGFVQTVMLGAYCAVVLWIDNARPAPHFIRGADSEVFIDAARRWPWDHVAAKVAPLYPVLINVTLRNAALLVLVQAVLWGLAWHWLARAVARWMSLRAMQVAAVAAIVGMSLASPMIVWNAEIGSDGLSIVCVVAAMASTLTAVDRRTPGWWLATAGLVSVCTMGRDTNVVLAAALGLGALIVAWRSREYRRSAIGALAILTATIVVSNVLASRAEPPRWYYPLQENIALRVAPNPEFRAWFADRGMPQAAELASDLDRYAADAERFESDAFGPFREWLEDNGPTVYARFVLTHPRWHAQQFFNARDKLFVSDHLDIARFLGAAPPRGFDFLAVVTYPRAANPMILWTIVAIVGLMIGTPMWSRGDRQRRGVLAVVIITGIVHAFLAFAGDALEVPRHTITAIAQLRIALWVAALLIVDRGIAHVLNTRSQRLHTT